MAARSGILGRSRIDTDEYDPLVFGDEQHGEVHFIRNDDLARGPYRSALWRLTDEHLPYESPYDFHCDETLCILEGEVEITFENGDQVVFREGDVVSIAGGTRSDWKITKPFKKLVVET